MAGEISVTKEDVEDAMGDYDQGPTLVLLRKDLLEKEAFHLRAEEVGVSQAERGGVLVTLGTYQISPNPYWCRITTEQKIHITGQF